MRDGIDVDARGLSCPEPVLLMHKAIKQASSGDTIKMLATDPSTESDIKKLCERLGCNLVRNACHDGIYVFHVEKAEGARVS